MKQTLYKLKDGKVHIWQIATDNIRNGYNIKTGLFQSLLQGKLHERFSPVEKGTNIGKSNERNVTEQILFIVTKKIKDKKLKSKCYDLIDLKLRKTDENKPLLDIDTLVYYNDNAIPLIEALLITLETKDNEKQSIIRPMLCKKYKDITGVVLNAVKMPCLAQPKLNGHRMICKSGIKSIGTGLFKKEGLAIILQSRGGKDIDTTTNIMSQMSVVYNSISRDENGYLIGYKNVPNKTLHITDLVFDGEAYEHDFELQRLSSAIKRSNADTLNVKYCIYDLAVSGLIYRHRLGLLEEIFKAFVPIVQDVSYLFAYKGIPNIKLVYTIGISAMKYAKDYYRRFLDAGFEGIIYRHDNVSYGFNKRVLIKDKVISDSEHLILDVIPSGRSNYHGKPIGMYKCQHNNKTFDVVPKMTLKERYELLLNKSNIGKQLTVNYYELTNKGIPLHAVGVAIREDYE